ncbi:GNAT family N-acetyltransferase [Streptomyces phaeochromogenes]|uniref:GNAT family N-acetyltransferase n=1 Tax=Streptomyces phaeochromogenes TaxID=1923 RepID=UPI00371E3233
MGESWRDVTHAWDALVAETTGTWPYHTATWGGLVADVFGGEFRVLRHSRCGWHVPIMLGGSLAAGGFACGHIGYGGVLAAETPHVPLHDQISAAAEIEAHLGVPCTRLVTTPGTPADAATGDSRQTLLVDLTITAEARWTAYAGSVRTAVRKCRREGLLTRLLGPSDAAAAVRLIHTTQLRVGATYQAPEHLIDRLARDTSGFSLLVGCFQRDRLLSVGVFLRAFGRVAYLFNGWDPECSRLGANYLMLHDAVERCGEQGDHVMDLGFSHAPGLRAFKERWNGRPATLTVAEQPVAHASIKTTRQHQDKRSVTAQ